MGKTLCFQPPLEEYPPSSKNKKFRFSTKSRHRDIFDMANSLFRTLCRHPQGVTFAIVKHNLQAHSKKYTQSSHRVSLIPDWFNASYKKFILLKTIIQNVTVFGIFKKQTIILLTTPKTEGILITLYKYIGLLTFISRYPNPHLLNTWESRNGLLHKY